jgi:ornithine carbamoyltransferase
MGEPDSVWKERIELFESYRVTAEVMAMTGNRHSKYGQLL